MSQQMVNFDQLVEIEGITKNQIEIFKEYKSGKNLFLYGPAGTGKTFVLLYNAIKEVLNPDIEYKKVYIVRSLINTREVGVILKDENNDLYQAPYDNMLRFMFKLPVENHFDTLYEELKRQKSLGFLSTSFLRGVTIDNSIIIVDECQNLNFHELDTIMTRVVRSYIIQKYNTGLGDRE